MYLDFSTSTIIAFKLLNKLEAWRENTHLQSRILQSESTPETNLALEKIKRPLYEKHPMSKFAWTIAEDTDTMEWYNICQDALRKVNESYQGKETADIIQNKVLQILKEKDRDMRLRLDKESKSFDFSGFHAECLTDTWIGNDRWAFIDLNAGPFSWGPAVGGEGVRTELSLPNVEKTVGAVQGIDDISFAKTIFFQIMYVETLVQGG
ncbi:uncharacterized protein E5676_scaffold1610G00260 [Cucumis melo var. makuwa]|uniref:DUF7906 domain-containing protein n=1 Tax=Cucumis melo var. makuwa TaxID=1194695 RepID=A0A5A7T9S2_CUCMM|nr:uncharacterized protein E6C27_scaffold270G00150 [Cucumis melo var. makuwa]TYK14786.1 uncharacterized protein E5676_scaffold1610G00260 [Cucumis melo var. makuwa]